MPVRTFSIRNVLIMKKIIICIIAAIIALTAKAATNDSICHISGTIDNSDTKEMLMGETGINFYDGDPIRIPVKDGKFSYGLKVTEPHGWNIVPDWQLEKGIFTPVHFITEPQHIVMHFGKTIDKYPTFKSDGVEMQRYKEFGDTTEKPWIPIFEKLDQQGDTIDENGDAYQEFQAHYNNVLDDFRVSQMEYIKSHPGFYGLLWLWEKLLYGDRGEKSGKAYQDLYFSTLDTVMPSHPYHAAIRSWFTGLTLEVGGKYIDYDVRGYDGNTVRLSSLLNGDIIYIYLWSSYCLPCRRHLMSFIPLYEKYKDKGFQVISIAREAKAESLKRAEEHDGYPWRSLLELNDEHHVWALNGVQDAVSCGWLIKSDGTILAKSPSVEETDRILKEQLGNNK